jgi:hypothetical protein
VESGIYKWRVVPCTVEKNFVDNEKFTVVVGNEFYGPGGLKFPDVASRRDGAYRTVFGGPVFVHPGVVYERSDNSLSQALRRQTGSRLPDEPGQHTLLETNQFRFCKLSRYVLKVIRELRQHVTARVAELKDHDLLMKDYAFATHPKKQERVRSYNETLDISGCDHETFVSFVTGKVKPYETAKWNKYARLFVSLGPTSILCAGFLIPYIKDAFASYHGWEHENRVSAFIPGPTLENLVRVFEGIRDTADMFVPYFSDDAAAGFRCADGLFMAELDFSSCDSSHTDVIFDIFEEICSDDVRTLNRVKAARRQCRKKMKLSSRADLKWLTVVLKAAVTCLFSGSVLTTIINNLGQLILFASLVQTALPVAERTVAGCPLWVKNAATQAGYILTCDQVKHFSELTFLKYFPCDIDGQITPCLALGVPLRALGVCWGDLPGGKNESLEDRAQQWNHMVVGAFIDAGRSSIMEKLRAQLSGRNLKARTLEHMRDRLAKQMPYHECLKILRPIPDVYLCDRYNISQSEVDEVVEMISNHHCLSVRTTATDKIFEKDYGFQTPMVASPSEFYDG